MMEGASGTSRQHFLIRLSETDRVCDALRALGEHHRLGGLAEATITALKAAHRQAKGNGVTQTAFRFRAPTGAEQLMVRATIKARRAEEMPLGLFLLGERRQDCGPPDLCA